MKKKKKEVMKKVQPLIEANHGSKYDTNGSYTGICYYNSDSQPVQDVDDL